MEERQGAGKRGKRFADERDRHARPRQAGKRNSEPSKSPGCHVRPRSAAEICGALALRQQGVVTRDQLLDAGISRHVIDRLAGSGSLHRLHRGVYAVGHLMLPPLARERAALLACGGRSLISHRSAAELWALLPSGCGDIDVTVVGHHCRAKPGIRLHRVVAIDDRDVRRKDGVLLTSPSRTLIDFAARAALSELEDAVAEARVRGLIRGGELEAAVQRAGRRPGALQMRAFLRQEEEPAITRSRAERVMRRLLRDARLPQPKSNVKVAGYEVDFLWPEQRVIVEVDGYRFHSHRSAFERDHRKDLALQEAGYLVIRITWRQLEHEPLAVIAHIARALDRRARARG